MKRRIIAIILTISAFFSITCFASATDYSQTNSTQSADNIILTQALALQNATLQNNHNFSVINLVTKNSEITAQNLTNNDNKVIQYVSENGENVEVVTIIPYAQQANGDLINSFDHIPNNVTTRGTGTVSATYVNITVTIITHYTKYFNSHHAAFFFRHDGVEAYWSSSNSSASVENLKVGFKAVGDLYIYPDLTNSDLSSAYVDPNSYPSNRTDDFGNYMMLGEIDVDFPTRGTTYADFQNVMPTYRYIRCTDEILHGGVASFEFTIPTSTRIYEKSFSIFGKDGYTVYD